MPIIYEPKGRAAEYSPLAANLYKGCGHGCTYCYAPAATRQDRKSFCSPAPRENLLEKLEKDAIRLRGDPRPVLLCFTCDPYQQLDVTLGVTREAIRILNANDLAVTILTKGGRRSYRDFDLLQKHPGNSYGTTLTFDDPGLSAEWEPGADWPNFRIEALIAANKLGIETWVSFEPVIDTAAVFRLIRCTHDFVDLYRVGKWNYDWRASEINWPVFRRLVTEELQGYGKRFVIKNDLQEAL